MLNWHLFEPLCVCVPSVWDVSSAMTECYSLPSVLCLSVFTLCRMWVQPWLNATHTSLCCAVCVLPVWQMWSVCVLPVCKMWAKSGWTLLTIACALCVCVCVCCQCDRCELCLCCQCAMYALSQAEHYSHSPVLCVACAVCVCVCVLPVWQMWAVSVLLVCDVWARSWLNATHTCVYCVCCQCDRC